MTGEAVGRRSDAPSRVWTRCSPASGSTAMVSGFLWTLVVGRAASEAADRAMLIGESGECVSAKETVVRAERLAATLLGEGVRPGMRVAWQLTNSIDAVLVLLALARLGAVQVPLDAALTEKQTRSASEALHVEAFICRAPRSGGENAEGPKGRPLAGRLLITSPSPSEGRRAGVPLPPYRAADGNPQWLFSTFTSAGMVQSILHTDISLGTAARGLLANAQFDHVLRSATGAVVVPIAEVQGLIGLAAMLVLGAPVVLIEPHKPPHIVGVLREFDIGVVAASDDLCGSLLTLRRALPRGSDLVPKMRLLVVLGDVHTHEMDVGAERELGAVVCRAYGCPEVPVVCTGESVDVGRRRGSFMGIPISGVRARVTVGGLPVREGVHGDIEVSGAGVCSGYVETAHNYAAFTDDGWYRTGDRGRLTLDGRLQVFDSGRRRH